MSEAPDKNVVQWVYSSRNPQELATRYDEWAKDYDADLDKDFGWIGPRRTVENFSRYVPADARILDATGKWKLVEVSERFQPLPKGEPEVYHQIWVYQVTA